MILVSEAVCVLFYWIYLKLGFLWLGLYLVVGIRSEKHLVLMTRSLISLSGDFYGSFELCFVFGIYCF